MITMPENTHYWDDDKKDWIPVATAPKISEHLRGPWKAVLSEPGGFLINPDEIDDYDTVEIAVVRGTCLPVRADGDDEEWRLPATYRSDDTLYRFEDLIVDDDNVSARWEQAKAVAAALNALPSQPEPEVTQEPEPAEFCDAPDGVIIALTGELDHVRRHITKQDNAYVTAILRLPDGSVLVEVPPAAYGQFGGLIAEGEIRDLTGSVDRRGEEPKLVVHAVATP